MLQRYRTSHARRLSFVVITALGLGGLSARSQAQEAGADALLAIDLNRSTVVDRIVMQWGGLLLPSGIVLDATQLRTRLSGLRADRLLAARLAGTSQGLQQVLTQADAATRRHARLKSLGDATVDLTYTPLTPCRIIDTRNAVGPLQPGVIRTEAGYTATTFAGQGGASSNCGIPTGVAALALNVVAVNPANLGFIKLWPANAAQPNASTINYDPTTLNIATGTIVRVDGANNNGFNAESPAQVQMVVDVVGYFKSAADATAMNLNVNGQRVMRYEYHDTSPNLIGGFAGNSASADHAGQTIAGGGLTGNCVFMGKSRPCSNETSGSFATVGGGFSNIAAGETSTVAGGNFNDATIDYATVSGGQNNTASGTGSTVSGGADNKATGAFSTVIGGVANSATGPSSVSAGHEANSGHPNTFVWNGWSSGSATSFRTNTFQIHGENGLDIEYGSRRADGGGTSWIFIGNAFAGQAMATSTGAYLTTGGAWTNNSDRARKTAVEPINPRVILDRLVTLPISTWRYSAEDAVRHIGPMAQDFHVAFGLGADDRTISTIDADGVALAAIQGLHDLLQAKDAQIEVQGRDITDLREQVSDMRSELEAVKRALSQTMGVSRRVTIMENRKELPVHQGISKCQMP